jgi:hypothetical protein
MVVSFGQDPSWTQLAPSASLTAMAQKARQGAEARLPTNPHLPDRIL